MKKLLFILLISVNCFAQEGMVLITMETETYVSETNVSTNHPYLQENLDKWKQGAEFENVNYEPVLSQVKSITYEPMPADQHWGVTNDKRIVINSRFVEFPELSETMLYQALGYVFGLDFEKKGLGLMSDNWLRNQKFENYALEHNSRPHDRKTYFLKLAKLHPMEPYHLF